MLKIDFHFNLTELDGYMREDNVGYSVVGDSKKRREKDMERIKDTSSLTYFRFNFFHLLLYIFLTRSHCRYEYSRPEPATSELHAKERARCSFFRWNTELIDLTQNTGQN